MDVERAADRVDRSVDVGVGVREAHDERWREDPAPDELLQEERPEWLRRALVAIPHREDEIARLAEQREVAVEAEVGDDVFDPAAQPFAAAARGPPRPAPSDRPEWSRGQRRGRRSPRRGSSRGGTRAPGRSAGRRAP